MSGIPTLSAFVALITASPQPSLAPELVSVDVVSGKIALNAVEAATVASELLSMPRTPPMFQDVAIKRRKSAY